MKHDLARSNYQQREDSIQTRAAGTLLFRLENIAKSYDIFSRRPSPVSEKSFDALHKVTVLSNMPSSSAILRCSASPKVTFSYTYF